MPHYWFSLKTHPINMRALHERKLKQNWNINLSQRQMRINSNLSDSIELDKTIYVESFNTQDSNHCFQSLRSIDQASSYPSVLKFGDKTATTPDSRHNCLTSFLDQSLVQKLSLILCFLPLKYST